MVGTSRWSYYTFPHYQREVREGARHSTYVVVRDDDGVDVRHVFEFERRLCHSGWADPLSRAKAGQRRPEHTISESAH